MDIFLNGDNHDVMCIVDFFLRKKVANSKKSSTFATAFEERNVDC